MGETIWSFLRWMKNPEKPDPVFAFLVLNQPIICDDKMVRSLWNKGVVRALADGGSNRWLDFLKNHPSDNLELPDFISGDFDSIKPETKAFFEEKKINFITTIDQDETDFTKALRCMLDIIKTKKLAVKFILVLCENCGRFDQIIGNINTLHVSYRILENIRVIILSSQSITWNLRPGKHIIRVTDEFIQNEYACGLMPFCGSTILTTSGLKWNLDNQESVMGGLISTSNTFVSTEVKVVCNRDVVWTTQYNPIKY